MSDTAQAAGEGPQGGTHWLKDELFERIRQDPAIIAFFDAGASGGLWYRALDRAGQLWFSPGAKALFGYAEHEMTDPAAWSHDHVNPDDRATALAAFERHRADPAHPYDAVVRFRHRLGHTVWVRCRGHILRDATGRPVRMLGTYSDLTALKRAEAGLEQHAHELEAQVAALQEQERRLERQARDTAALARSMDEARANLEELNAQKDTFFSIVAHDLKSPFTPLLGFSELLATQGATLPPARVVEYGALLHRAATEAFKLLEDLLDWSRIQLDRVTYDPMAVDVAELIGHNVAHYQYAAQGKGVDMRVEETGPVTAWADPRMMDTVLRNLLSNAVKFTRPGDRVRIAASQDGHGPVTVTVQDTGIGIPAATIPRLFELGARTSAKGTHGETGTGMGLVICKELMDRQGGTIAAESTEGAGTTFRLGLPGA